MATKEHIRNIILPFCEAAQMARSLNNISFKRPIFNIKKLMSICSTEINEILREVSEENKNNELNKIEGYIHECINELS